MTKRGRKRERKMVQKVNPIPEQVTSGKAHTGSESESVCKVESGGRGGFTEIAMARSEAKAELGTKLEPGAKVEPEAQAKLVFEGVNGDEARTARVADNGDVDEEFLPMSEQALELLAAHAHSTEAYVNRHGEMMGFQRNGNRYGIEYAKSDRSTCRGKCGSSIAKGTPRFGSSCERLHGSFSWRHLHCVTGRQLKNVENTYQTGDYSVIPGWRSVLTPREREEAVTFFDKAKFKAGEAQERKVAHQEAVKERAAARKLKVEESRIRREKFEKDPKSWKAIDTEDLQGEPVVFLKSICRYLGLEEGGSKAKILLRIKSHKEASSCGAVKQEAKLEEEVEPLEGAVTGSRSSRRRSAAKTMDHDGDRKKLRSSKKVRKGKGQLKRPKVEDELIKKEASEGSVSESRASLKRSSAKGEDPDGDSNNRRAAKRFKKEGTLLKKAKVEDELTKKEAKPFEPAKIEDELTKKKSGALEKEKVKHRLTKKGCKALEKANVRDELTKKEALELEKTKVKDDLAEKEARALEKATLKDELAMKEARALKSAKTQGEMTKKEAKSSRTAKVKKELLKKEATVLKKAKEKKKEARKKTSVPQSTPKIGRAERAIRREKRRKE